MRVLIKYLDLMDKASRSKFIILIFLLFFAGLMELIGLAMIIPIINIILEPEYIYEISREYNFSFFIEDFDRLKLTLFILLLTLFIYIFKNIYLFLVNWYQVNFLKSFISILSTKIFRNIIKKKYLYFTNSNSASFIKTMTADSILIKNNLNYCAQIIAELFTIFFISTLLFITHPFAMITSVILFFSGTIIFLLLLKKKTKIWAEERNHFDRKRISIVKQVIGSIRDLKLLNVEEKFLKSFENDNLHFLSVNRKNDFTLTLPKIWIELLTIFTILLLLFILIFLDDNQVVPKSIIPLLALYVGSSFKLIPSFNRIITGVQSLRFATPVLNEYKILSVDDLRDSEKFTNKDENISLNKKIKINNLSFSYNSKNNILENLNLEIDKSKKIGILGPSGSGKSTFLDIFTGIIDEYEGEVLVDGKNIKDGIRSWRNSISYLSQSSAFLNDTIKNNILLGSNEINQELIYKSINNSLIGELVNSLPLKENTIIGENGMKLSGGEKQRLALARIFYLQRDILILDESTNALDEDTENKVLENIWRNFSDKTIIQVTHNPKILKNCDKVYKLVNKSLV